MSKKRFLKKFNSQSDYESQKNSVMDMPHVVLLTDTKKVVYKPRDYSKEYFTIETLESGTFTLSKPISSIDYETDDATLVSSMNYRINNGDWIETSEAVTLDVNANDTIQISCEAISCRTFIENDYASLFNTEVPFNIYGNVMSLLFGDNFQGQTSLEGYNGAFIYTFLMCNTLVSAKNLILPATTLASGCYSSMFQGCTNLTIAPELLATTLSDNCYNSMFNGCSKLTTAPELPATTLANWCYSYMFEGCTNLTEAPTLLATTLADGCYYGMFEGCTALTEALELPATTLAVECYLQMFYGCTSLTKAPELPATTLANWCYSSMFQGCTALTEAPELSTTELTDYCYYGMFEGCTALTEAPELPATELADYCYGRMFRGCTSLTKAPQLPATTLVKSCYGSMFKDCVALSEITMLATDISATNCLSNWVDGVGESGTFTQSPTINLPLGVNGIPANWSIIYDYNIESDGEVNGYEYVDLGLPSGTLWATKPISNENNEVLYFAWASTEGATTEQIINGDFTFSLNDNTNAYFDSSTEYYTKYIEDDGKVVLDLEDDAAHVHMGGDWHMPTKEQCDELIENTTSVWTTVDGINGKLFTASNGKSIFVPAFGFTSNGTFYHVDSYGWYWSSSVFTGEMYMSLTFTFYSSKDYIGTVNRSDGNTIIGVVG